MGQVYKLVNDLDNSICCYVKAIDMMHKKISTCLDHADAVSLNVNSFYSAKHTKEQPRLMEKIIIHFFMS